VDHETRAYLDDMRLQLDRRFEAVESRVGELNGEVRRHFGVLVEHSRHETQIIAEMVGANTEAIADLRQRLDAR